MLDQIACNELEKRIKYLINHYSYYDDFNSISSKIMQIKTGDNNLNTQQKNENNSIIREIVQEYDEKISNVVSILTELETFLRQQKQNTNNRQGQCLTNKKCSLKSKVYCNYLLKEIEVCDKNCTYRSDNFFIK